MKCIQFTIACELDMINAISAIEFEFWHDIMNYQNLVSVLSAEAEAECSTSSNNCLILTAITAFLGAVSLHIILIGLAITVRPI